MAWWCCDTNLPIELRSTTRPQIWTVLHVHSCLGDLVWFGYKGAVQQIKSIAIFIINTLMTLTREGDGGEGWGKAFVLYQRRKEGHNWWGVGGRISPWPRESCQHPWLWFHAAYGMAYILMIHAWGCKFTLVLLDMDMTVMSVVLQSVSFHKYRRQKFQALKVMKYNYKTHVKAQLANLIKCITSYYTDMTQWPMQTTFGSEVHLCNNVI